MRLISLLILVSISAPAFGQEPVASIPFEIKNGHIYIELKINGSDPLPFVFDTGAAANVMTDHAAESLNIAASGRQTVQGASGSTSIKTANGVTLIVGRIQFEQSTFLILNLDHLADEDTPLSGIVGASILNNFIVSINYDQSEIKLYNQSNFEAPKDWEAHSFSLRTYQVPVIEATITLPSGEKLTGPYLVDTGAATTVKFNTPFVRKNELISELGDHYPYTSRALSNESTDEVSKLPGYEVFGHTFKDFPVRLSQVRSGVSSRSDVHGILGLHILKRFNTIYDYSRRVMYLKPGKLYNETFALNHDGLKVRKQGGAFLVEAVFKNSAAEKAQIQVGDIINSVDGHNELTRSEFHRYFQEAKKPVAVVLQRNGRQMKIQLIPTAML
jgi:hypothetical protein